MVMERALISQGGATAMGFHPIGCRNLATAICRQAAKDYRKSRGKDIAARDFFLHDRILRTLNVDGEMILSKLDAEIHANRQM
jgi:hypothetical protein